MCRGDANAGADTISTDVAVGSESSLTSRSFHGQEIYAIIMRYLEIVVQDSSERKKKKIFLQEKQVRTKPNFLLCNHIISELEEN